MEKGIRKKVVGEYLHNLDAERSILTMTQNPDVIKEWQSEPNKNNLFIAKNIYANSKKKSREKFVIFG